MGINIGLNINLIEFYKNGEELLKKYKYKQNINSKQAFGDYINTILDRYLKVKTLLYRYEPKYFYSFYEEPLLRKNNNFIRTDNIKNIFNKDNKIIISGIGGMGKSMLMQHFLLSSIAHELYIPILIPLRILNDKEIEDISILNIMHNSLTECNFRLDIGNMEYIMQRGGLLILFDGYDEVKEEISHKVLTEINSICNQYFDNIYVLSSRPDDRFIGLNNFIELQTEPLSKEQALNLIKKFEYDEDIKKRFYDEFNNNLYKEYEDLVTNPLLLTIMFITYIEIASIPDNLNEFYEQSFRALFVKHDSTKAGFRRERKCNLPYTDFKKVFSHVCFKSFFISQYDFTETQLLYLLREAKNKLKIEFKEEDYLKDIINIMCMFVKDGLKYKFIHRSFQEYFAAIYTTELSDSVQTKLLAERVFNWPKYKDYFNVLYYLEKDRFDKNMLYPNLLKLRDAFNECGKSYYEFLKISCGGIEINSNGIVIYKISVTPYINFMFFIIQLKKYKVVGDSRINSFEFFVKKYSLVPLTEYKIEELRNIFGSEEKVLDFLYPFTQYVDFCLKLLEELETNLNLSQLGKLSVRRLIDQL